VWLDLWGQLQTRALRLEAAVVLLAVVVAGLFGLSAWLVLRPAPIYYIPATAGPGLLTPGAVPEALAADFAQQVLLMLYNFTPATARLAYRETEKYLHPRLLTPFRVRAERELREIEEQQIASQLSIRSAEVTGDTSERLVRVRGLRRVYVGKLPVRDEEIEVQVKLLRVQPGPLNPHGLVVADLQVGAPPAREERP